MILRMDAAAASHRHMLQLGAGRLVVVGEDVDRTLSKNQHILNIVPTSPQHSPHPHVLSTRNPTT